MLPLHEAASIAEEARSPHERSEMRELTWAGDPGFRSIRATCYGKAVREAREAPAAVGRTGHGRGRIRVA